MAGLMAAADIVISLHRSEGFGLVPAQAMALGKPVIATAWSGNLDFMNKNNSALVSYSLVPVHDPEGAFQADDQSGPTPMSSKPPNGCADLPPTPICARDGRRRRQDVAAQLSPKHFASTVESLHRSRGTPLMSPPRIAINGRFLTQRASGVQRFAMEAIKAIDALLDGDYAALKGRVEFLAPRKARDFPLKNIPLRRVGFSSGYAWEQFEFPFHAAGAVAAQSVHARAAGDAPPARGRARRHRARAAGEFFLALPRGLWLSAAAAVPARRAAGDGLRIFPPGDRQILRRRYRAHAGLPRGRRSHHRGRRRPYRAASARSRRPQVLSRRRRRFGEQEYRHRRRRLSQCQARRHGSGV